jgi:predicted ester cyclase
MADSPADHDLADRFRRYLEDTGTHTGAPFLGVAATGRSVKTTEPVVDGFSGGLITEVWSVSDRLDVLGQLTGDH